MTNKKCPLLPVVLVAALLFFPLFIFRGVGAFDFWWWITTNILILLAAALYLDRDMLPRLRRDFTESPGRKIFLGIISAALLYGVFFLGNYLSRLLFPEAGDNINSVYAFKIGASSLRVTLLLTFIIGPGEELFWRIFLQEQIARRRGHWGALFLSTLIYTGVHLGSANPMLLVAALFCGLTWGALYLWQRSPLLIIVSHTVWDLAIFLIFPLET